MQIKSIKKVFSTGVIAISMLLSSCSAPPTVAAVILIDPKAKPIPKSNVTILATDKDNKSSTAVTNSAGQANVIMNELAYPVIITAADGQHHFSSVTLNNANTVNTNSKISIVMSDRVLTQ